MFGNNNFDGYVTHQEGEALKIIPKLDEESIIDITKNGIINRYDFNILVPNNNLPLLLEQTYKQGEVLYPESVEELEAQKNRLLSLILDTISQECEVQIEIPENASLYSYTYYIYDFLVSNFKQYLINFFTNYIVKEKNSIYQNMNLSMYKKEKNTSTKYGKTLYTNPKMAIITSYLHLVIQNLTAYDISLETILYNVYSNSSIITSILESVFPINDFYQTQYVSLITNPYISQSIISNIRFALHNISINQ